MTRRPVYVPAGATVLVTRETWMQRCFLRPDPEFDAMVLGVLGRVHALAPVDLHAFSFEPSRVRLLMTVPHQTRLSAFLGHLFKMLADLIHAERAWSMPLVWAYHSGTRVFDAASALEGLRIIHEGPVTDGLIAHPTDWPGLSSAAALVGDEELVAVWPAARDRRRGIPGQDRIVSADSVYPLPLAPLPVLATSPREDRVALVAELFDLIAQGATPRRRPSLPLGRRWVLELDPLLPDPRNPRHAEVRAQDARWGLRPASREQASR